MWVGCVANLRDQSLADRMTSAEISQERRQMTELSTRWPTNQALLMKGVLVLFLQTCQASEGESAGPPASLMRLTTHATPLLQVREAGEGAEGGAGHARYAQRAQRSQLWGSERGRGRRASSAGQAVPAGWRAGKPAQCVHVWMCEICVAGQGVPEGCRAGKPCRKAGTGVWAGSSGMQAARRLFNSVLQGAQQGSWAARYKVLGQARHGVPWE